MSELFWIGYAALWTITALLLFGLFVLFRHHGAMLLNSRPVRSAQGPGDGSRFPQHTMVDLDHNAWHVPTEGRPQLIVIAVRDCRLCAKTLVALDAFSREHAGTMSTAFVYGGSAAALVELATRQSVPIDGTLRFVSDPRGAIQQATRVTHTPYAFMIDADGTIVRSGLASEQRHLLWLAEALREPRTTNHKVMATA